MVDKSKDGSPLLSPEEDVSRRRWLEENADAFAAQSRWLSGTITRSRISSWTPRPSLSPSSGSGPWLSSLKTRDGTVSEGVPFT
jgi:hypothetical protein